MIVAAAVPAGAAATEPYEAGAGDTEASIPAGSKSEAAAEAG